MGSLIFHHRRRLVFHIYKSYVWPFQEDKWVESVLWFSDIRAFYAKRRFWVLELFLELLFFIISRLDPWHAIIHVNKAFVVLKWFALDRWVHDWLVTAHVLKGLLRHLRRGIQNDIQLPIFNMRTLIHEKIIVRIQESRGVESIHGENCTLNSFIWPKRGI